MAALQEEQGKRTSRRRGWVAAVAALAAGALSCAGLAQAAPGGGAVGGAVRAGTEAMRAGALQRDFTRAAEEFHVPAGVLMAVAYQQGRWDAHGGSPSTTGNYNVMGLTHVDDAALRVAHAVETDQRGAEAPTTGGKARTASPARDAHAHARPTDRVRPAPRTATTGKADAKKPTDATDAADTSDATETAETAETAAYRTLDAAAALTHATRAQLRTDSGQSVRGGAALLAQYEKQLTGKLPADPGAWYAAVAKFSQSTDAQGAAQYADRVYATLRAGATRTTDTGQKIALAPEPTVIPEVAGLRDLGLVSADEDARARVKDGGPAGGSTAAAAPTPECPSGLTCNFVPAAYKQNDPKDKSKYGNYDLANRPADGNAVQYIVIHDTEGSYSGSISEFQDSTALASPHYLVRSSDGLVTQLVETKNVAWHAGNYYVNTHSVGIEHEGIAISGASWYTESLYQSSAALVRYLAARFGVPLDRQHVIGHDDVPAPQTAQISGMHWDPGPYWNWSHYMDLLGAPISGGQTPVAGGTLTIDPPFTSANQPALTGCTRSCKAQPTSFVYLRTSPSATAPLIKDAVMHAQGASDGTTQAADVTDKAVAGQTFVVAEVQGDWTAIWYGGQKAWFSNPGGQFAKAGTTAARVVAPKGSAAVPVYGRAYPEASAYPAVISAVAKKANQIVGPLGYTFPAGQAYAAGDAVTSDYFYAENIDQSAPGDQTRVVGTTVYYPIRFNHRIAFVRADDVTESAAAVPSAEAPAPDGAAKGG